MKTREFNVVNETLFTRELLAFFNDGEQFGYNNFIDKPINKIGYAINLTVDIVKQAKEQKVDLILTHHNIWSDLLEIRTECLKLLKEYGIIHYFNHLPLDASLFGPTRMLAKDLGVTVIEEIVKWDKYAFGVVGEFSEAIELSELESRFDKALGHKSRVWQNNNKLIRRVGIVAGSAGEPDNIKEAINHNCDAYITGEKKLKSLLYAKHTGINFLLGSHNFTEIAGLRAYANRLKEKLPELIFIELTEDYIE